MPYTILGPVDADNDDCALRDASAGVELVSDETCTSPSVVSFSMSNATADPVAPATEPGSHSVTFTANQDHRFADGSRELTLPYSIVGPLDADDDTCAVDDAVAAVVLVSAETCTAPSVVSFSMTNATADPVAPATEPGDHSVTFTALPGHRFADDSRSLTLPYTIVSPLDADDDRCAGVGRDGQRRTGGRRLVLQPVGRRVLGRACHRHPGRAGDGAG